EVGNGDPRIAIFPDAITPNQHAMARTFVTLDNFLVSGEGSWTGWQWTTAGRTSDFAERNDFMSLAGRGGEYAQSGVNRNLNVGYATEAERREKQPNAPDDDDLLPGARDVAALDGPRGEAGKGFIWDAAIRGGLSVRNYGFFSDGRVNAPALVRDPFTE